MSAPIINRRLILHYMRATGWAVGAERSWFAMPATAGRVERAVTVPASYSDRDVMSTLALVEGRPSIEVAARIARCADAEYALRRARTMEFPGSAPRDALKAAYLCMAEDLLSTLGLTTHLWETTRVANDSEEARDGSV